MSKYEYTGKTVVKALENALNDLKVNRSDVTYTIIDEGSKGFLGFGGKDVRIAVNLKEKRTPAPTPVAKPNQEAPKAKVVSNEKPVAMPTKKVESDKTDIEIIEASTFSPVKNDLTGHTKAEERPAQADLSVEILGDKVASTEDLAPIDDLVAQFLGPIFEALDTNPTLMIQENDQEIQINVDGEHIGLLIGRRGETLKALQLLVSTYINKELRPHKRIIFDVGNYREKRIETLENLAQRMADKARTEQRRVRLNPMNAAERRLIHLALEGQEDITTYSEGKDPHRRIVIVPNN